MAEGIISCVMQKLTDAVVNEFLLQHGIGDQVEALNRELSRLQAFLKDVDKKQIRVESQKHWILNLLDDVWTTDLWTQIGVALPDELNGSRVLVTSRFLGIARSTNSSCEPHKPQYLNEQLSLELFLKKALPNHDPNQPYDHDLLGIAEKFAKKCGGLPLALVVLGGYLSKRQPKFNDWRKALKTLNWHADGTECIEIIASSYDDLPYALKSCFMYFAAFLEDYDIDALQVIRMWVAEGFIPQEESRTFEDTAESFLEDLVQRGLIQATQRSNNGSILYCRIHDLLRDVAVQKAKEENVFMVCSNPDEQRSFNGYGARRVAVHDSHFNELVKCASRNLRSLLCFGSQMPNCCEHTLLKVLYCPDAFLETFESLEGLTQLKYLNFRIQIGNRIEHFQGLIGRMRFMQTLDLTVDYANGDILENIWHIKTLRHVALNYLTPPQSCTSFLGPPLSEKQSNLQTLVGVTCRESWIQEPPKLPNLRDLDIHIPQGFPWSVIVTLLGTLRHLASLAIWGFDIPTNIVNMTGFSFYEHLQNLDLVEWSSTALALELNAGFFPVHLNRLSIVGLPLQVDPMPVLETLRHLKYLNIWKTKIKRMTCSAAGFQQLEELRLFKLDDIEELEIEMGALSMLKKLEVGYCDRLCVPQGLQHLTNLHELQWFFGSNTVATTQANEIRNLCQHVPSICISGAGVSF